MFLNFSKPLLRPDWHQFLQYKCTQDSLPVHKYNCTKHSVYATLGEAKCVHTAFYRVAVIFIIDKGMEKTLRIISIMMNAVSTTPY
jgi:hypothetical protein